METIHLAPSLVALLPLSVVGVGLASWLDGDQEGDGDGDGGDGDFGMDDFGDGEFGDGNEFDDDFGGMGDMDGGSEVSTAELETRIEGLEAEIADVSSTANTVRSENEQISEAVDEVEENVRKLLEIYEMVTRGVNPFVDEVGGGMGMGVDDGGFGLFDETGEDAETSSEDDLDDELASAEADDFFDDDAFDEIEDDPGTDDGFDVGGVSAGDDFDLGGEVSDDAFEAEDTPTMNDATEVGNDEGSGSASDSGGGTSFEELKAEYESGEADWADDFETETGDDAETDDTGFEDEDTAPAGDDSIDVGEEDLFQQEDLEKAKLEEPPDATQSTEPSETELAATTESEGDTIGGFRFGRGATSGERTQYLSTPPDGYLADVVVLEWLSFLLDEFDPRNAVRAINYYRRIGWIGEEMRDHLITVLMGLTDSEYLYRDEFGTTELTMADHKRSLEYIEELSGGNLDRRIADRLDLLKA